MLQLIQKSAQRGGANAMVNLPADREVWTLLAPVLAESSAQMDRGFQTMLLHVLVNDGEVFRVAARKAGTSKADHDLDRFHILSTWRCTTLDLQLHKGSIRC